MIVSQRIDFHLSTDETMFAQIIKVDRETFSAQLSPVCARGTRQAQKLFQWLACPESKTGISVFHSVIRMVGRQCATLGDRRLVMVSNPDGWHLVSKAEQKREAGDDVAIVAFPPQGLVGVN